MTAELDIEKCFQFAKRVTLEAGVIMKHGFETEKEISQKRDEWDVVTNYDRKLEELFTDAIKKEYPDHKIIGEEGMAGKKELPELTDAPTWLIDPIDGTLNYIHSFPHTVISVAVAYRKEVVIGLVYNPMTSELYTAVKGGGAFLNGNPIRPSKATELKRALIIIESFVLRPATKNRDIEMGRYEAIVAGAHAVRSLGCAALALSYLAKGAIGCFHMDALQPWDVAAGMLIAREAGATVIDTKGGEYNFMKPKTVAAGTEELAIELSKLIVDTDLKTQRKRLQRS